jgi:RNA polymerase sigma-32 factor
MPSRSRTPQDRDDDSRERPVATAPTPNNGGDEPVDEVLAEEPIDPEELALHEEPDLDGLDASASDDDAATSRRAPRALVPSRGQAERSLDVVPALSAYMSKLGAHAPISREDEHELAVRWVEHRDVEAARQLVLANLRLVVKIAMEYRRAWTNALDLIQEGNVGLMEAVQRFDPHLGVKLSTYAVYWIRAYILKYILDNFRSVRLGTTRAQRKLFFRLNRERRNLEQQGFEVTPMLIAERLDVSEDDVRQMEGSLSGPDLYLDAPIRRDEPGATRGDFLVSGVASAEDTVGDREMHRVFMQHVSEFAADLSPRDRQILDQRVLADEPRTLAELGVEFGVTRERVRQLEARLVNRLREYLRERVVDFDYYAESKE